MRASLLVRGVLAAAVLALAAPPAAAFSVTAVSLSVSPASSNGPCPVKFTFSGKVTLTGRGEFRYKWERSDGAVDTTGPHTAAYDGVHPTIVTETWTLGAAGLPAFHPFHGSVTLHVLAPTDKSATAHFTLDCGAPPTAGGNPTGGPNPNCNGKPDLVPVLSTPMNGTVGVKNIGTGVAGPSLLKITCARAGYPGPGGGCVDVPASLITAPFVSLPDGLGLRVPELSCGKSFMATAPWWANLVWPKGTYNFTATADATNLVAESNEGNNGATSSMTR